MTATPPSRASPPNMTSGCDLRTGFRQVPLQSARCGALAAYPAVRQR